jgi:hypothetical protein
VTALAAPAPAAAPAEAAVDAPTPAAAPDPGADPIAAGLPNASAMAIQLRELLGAAHVTPLCSDENVS